MDNLQDLLSQKKYSEPPELKLLKDYIKEQFDSEVTIKSDNNNIIITAPNSALASRLHSDSLKLQDISKTDKKIKIYTGS